MRKQNYMYLSDESQGYILKTKILGFINEGTFS